MFKVRRKPYSTILTVYSINRPYKFSAEDDTYFLVYDENKWRWINSSWCEPVEDKSTIVQTLKTMEEK